jgi:hypothetical protein
MPQLIVNLSEELNESFRLTVFKKKGMRKGNISEAVFEALNLWIKANQT